MFLAKPYANNFSNCQRFKTIREAKSFLDKYTEYQMPVFEWISIGKILGTDNIGHMGNVYNLSVEDYK